MFPIAELLEEELPPVRWAVPDVLPEGVTLFAGKPKVGKTWLAQGLAAAVATGGVALGKVPVEQGDVLYLALEDNRRRLQRRFKKLLGGRPLPPRLDAAIDWPRLDEGGADELEDWLIGHSDARLVVIDTLAKIRPRVRGANLYAEDYAALERLLPLTVQHGVSILVIHHTRKLQADDPSEEMSGTFGLTGGVDGTLVIRRGRGDADAYLHVDGRDIEDAAEHALDWDSQLAAWTLQGDAEEYRLSKERREGVGLLERNGDPMGPKEAADGLDKDPVAVRKMLRRMDEAGQVRQVTASTPCTAVTLVTTVTLRRETMANPRRRP